MMYGILILACSCHTFNVFPIVIYAILSPYFFLVFFSCPSIHNHLYLLPTLCTDLWYSKHQRREKVYMHHITPLVTSCLTQFSNVCEPGFRFICILGHQPCCWQLLNNKQNWGKKGVTAEKKQFWNILRNIRNIYNFATITHIRHSDCSYFRKNNK